MMRNLLFLAMTAIATAAIAAPVKPAKALSEARQFCRDRETKGLLSVHSQSEMRVVYTADDAEYYVVDRGDDAGYVIVSGDDCTQAILGYVDRGSFNYDELPTQMKAWLDGYARQIKAAAAVGAAPIQTATHAKVEPLLTTTWSQPAPYNNLTPIYPGTDTHCVTGCVATATAQVMKYYKWPEQATGIGQATCAGETLTLDMTGDTFQWDKMLDSYAADPNAEGAGTEEERNAVALLMRDVGFASNMLYTNHGSGSYTCNAMYGLVNNFSYDKSAHCEKLAWYTAAQWDDLVYSEISTYGPIVMAGSQKTYEAGHAFVCDGYDGEGLYHFNWGWNGLSNGYFSLSALDPVHSSGETYAFDYDVQIIAGLKKAEAGSNYKYQLGLESSIRPYESMEGTFIFCDVCNYSSGLLTGTMGFQVENLADNTITYKPVKNITSAAPGPVTEALSDESLNLPDGKYRVRIAFKETNGECTLCRSNLGATDALLLTIKDGVKSYSVEGEVAYDYVLPLENSQKALVKNRASVIGVEVRSNGVTHDAEWSCKIIDQTTGTTLLTSKNTAKMHFDINHYADSAYFQLDAFDYDLSHKYEIQFLSGEKEVYSYLYLRAVATPEFEVIEPLKVENLDADGCVDVNDGVTLTMKLRNLNSVPFNNVAVSAEGTKHNPFTLRVDTGLDDFNIAADGDVVTLTGQLHWNIIDMLIEGNEAKLQLLYTIGVEENVYAIEPVDKTTVSFKVKDTSGVEKVSADGSAIAASEVYNLQGICVGKCAGKASMKDLQPGVYIVKQTTEAGDVVTAKQVVR